MKRFEMWCLSVAICCTSGTALGRAPLIDPPTPPPCAADGICYPKTHEWGYYPARWRTWPRTQLEPTPAKAPTEAGRVSEELGPSEPPPAEIEDAAAPPSSARPRETSDAASPPGEMPAGEAPTITPPDGDSGLPNIPLPDAERLSPLGPTSDSDPPPMLPHSLSASTQRLDRVPRNGSPAARSATARVSSNDPPPAPPWTQSASL